MTILDDLVSEPGSHVTLGQPSVAANRILAGSLRKRVLLLEGQVWLKSLEYVVDRIGSVIRFVSQGRATFFN